MQKLISFFIIILLLVGTFVYAKNNNIVQNAAAICGAVITRDDGKRVTYTKKCESCGKTAGSSSITVYPGSSYKSSFRCSKCKNNQKIEIVRSR